MLLQTCCAQETAQNKLRRRWQCTLFGRRGYSFRVFEPWQTKDAGCLIFGCFHHVEALLGKVLTNHHLMHRTTELLLGWCARFEVPWGYSCVLCVKLQCFVVWCSGDSGSWMVLGSHHCHPILNHWYFRDWHQRIKLPGYVLQPLAGCYTKALAMLWSNPWLIWVRWPKNHTIPHMCHMFVWNCFVLALHAKGRTQLMPMFVFKLFVHFIWDLSLA